MSTLPPCPTSLKSIQHYLKTASEHDQRDPIVSYWARLYALQLALKIDRKSDDAKALLNSLMDWLEIQKKALAENEAISNDIAAQAHLENYALKLFIYADSQDRAANFGKNVVKAFYTAGIIFDILTTFGELSEEIAQNRKYAKWKAAYIHNCLKNGETPIPGPLPQEDENPPQNPGPSTPMGFVAPQPENPPENPNINPFFPADLNPPLQPTSNFNIPIPSISPSTPVEEVPGNIPENNTSGKISLDPEHINKAQKYCKWAASALTYDDIPTAILNLKKGLKLLETGIDS